MTGKFGWERFAFGFGPRAWGFRGRRSGGRRQWFGAGDMKYVILKLLRDKPRHGYEVMKELEERMHGCYSPSPGTVYPTLGWLDGRRQPGVGPAREGRVPDRLEGRDRCRAQGGCRDPGEGYGGDSGTGE